jgi:hypothetical protein
VRRIDMLTTDDLKEMDRHRERVEGALVTAEGFAGKLEQLDTTFATPAQRQVNDFVREKLAQEVQRLLSDALIHLDQLHGGYYAKLRGGEQQDKQD